MVYFKTKDGALIPFTQPLMVSERVDYYHEPDRYDGLKTYSLSITMGGYVIWEDKAQKRRDQEVRDILRTMLTYIHETIEDFLDEGITDFIIQPHVWAKELIE